MALLIITKNGKQPKCPSTDEWINQLWYFHSIEHHTAVKNKELLIPAIIWMRTK